MMNQRVGYKMLIIWMCTLMLINVSWAAQHRGKIYLILKLLILIIPFA